VANGNTPQLISSRRLPKTGPMRKHGSIWVKCCYWGDETADSGNFDQAVLRYRESLAYRPADVELHTSLGMALAKLARLNEARSEFEAAMRIDPGFQPARQALAAIQGK
jgi:tetratricopeptide (TPR) repeat protein